ncbi:MAG TPA: DUF4384 domain-containing protein [Pyrinomonadaceae bacterium]|nr:DUF4384 domain-containing protein [Pyrinomonadaceae bacterium]
MRFKIFTTLLALALFSCASVIIRAQDEDEAVRGSFLTTRTKSSSNSGSTSASTTITSAANNVTSKPSNKPTSSRSERGSTTSRTSGSVSVKGSTGRTSASVKANGSVTTAAPVSAYSPSAIGLGYTIYMRDASGNAVRVDPSQEFHAGDRIRLALESNTDGYLYIFHTENDSNPEMLYPDVRLEKGANRIQAHVPYEIPWNEPNVENWFKFDETPANERLYIVISRQPLPSIPVGESLVDYCAKNSCPWHPRVEDWAKVKMNVQTKVGIVKSSSYGQKQTAAEREATTRGLGLDQSAPEPSVIRMNASSNAPVLVTAVDLIHK